MLATRFKILFYFKNAISVFGDGRIAGFRLEIDTTGHNYLSVPTWVRFAKFKFVVLFAEVESDWPSWMSKRKKSRKSRNTHLHRSQSDRIDELLDRKWQNRQWNRYLTFLILLKFYFQKSFKSQFDTIPTSQTIFIIFAIGYF